MGGQQSIATTSPSDIANVSQPAAMTRSAALPAPSASGSTSDSKGNDNNNMEIGEGMNLVDDAYEEKMASFEVDCNDGKGVAKACHHVGEFYSVVKDSHERSAKIYQENCYGSNEYHPSCFNLGRLYLGGKGVEQNDQKATELFKRACEGDHLFACYHHGVFQYHDNVYKERKGGVKKYQDENKVLEAISVLEKACEGGESESCSFAGNHYISEVEKRNPKAAVNLFEKGCARNHVGSCYNLAVLFKNGDDGVPADMAKFEEYKDRTAELQKMGLSLNSTQTN